MVQLTYVLMTLLAASASSVLAKQKPIGQRIADSTRPWARACKKAGGGVRCHTVSKVAALTLLSVSGTCDQQDAADKMIDLAKTLNNNADMIELAQIFVQQPRNSRDRLQVPYCQKPPKNAELNGYFHCQFSGSDLTKFSGNQTGNLPLGVVAVVPPGSCPAFNSSVPNGMQLNKLVLSPGIPTRSRSSTVSRDVTSGPSDGASMGDCDPDGDGNPGPSGSFSNGTGSSFGSGSISSSLLSNGSLPTFIGNGPISSLLNNGTDPSSLGNATSLFSGLLGSNTTTPDASDPGSILRRVAESEMKNAKPEHVPFKSHHKSRPKHEHGKPKPKHKHHKSRPKHHKHHKSKAEHGKAKSGHKKVRPGQAKHKLAHTRPGSHHHQSHPQA